MDTLQIYLAVDDTDTVESRGTGFRSRQMASELELAGHGRVSGVTRHQLCMDPALSFTSQNSSNCLEIETREPEKLWSFCTRFLIRENLPGSDTGLCMAVSDRIPETVEEFGRRAKEELLTMEEARQLADEAGIRMEGLTGDGSGVIGALAALGLRKTGNDGRYIWQPGKQLRDMSGTVTVEELLKGTRVHAVLSKDGILLDPTEWIDLTDWVRAVLINGKAFVIAERNRRKSGSRWVTSDKGYLKEISS